MTASVQKHLLEYVKPDLKTKQLQVILQNTPPSGI